jgi:hypothetical protein
MQQDALDRLLDEREIHDVLLRYCRGIDRLDEELLRSVYHDDAYDDHGVFKGSGPEFVDWVLPILRDQMQASMHLLSNVRIEVDGPFADCESYVIAHHRRTVDDRLVLDTVGGRYVDRMEKRAEQWRIARRVVVLDWSRIDTIEREFPMDAYTQGLRSRDDLSYAPGG